MKTFKPLLYLMPYLWPKNNKNFKIRLILAICFLIFAKLANVSVRYSHAYTYQDHQALHGFPQVIPCLPLEQIEPPAGVLLQGRTPPCSTLLRCEV